MTAPHHRTFAGASAEEDRRSGFTLIELMIAVGILLVVAAAAMPIFAGSIRYYRLSGDARGIGQQLALTKMRAAANYTRAQLNVDLTSGNYRLELCTTKGATTCTTFTADGGTHFLSSGVTFSFGTISAPAGTQATIGQTTPILFNSRGIPIATNGTPTGNDALYLTNGTGEYCAVTISASGQIAVWRWRTSAWVRI